MFCCAPGPGQLLFVVELLGALGGGADSVDEHGAEPMLFERRHRGDGGSARGSDLIAQDGGVLVRVNGQLGSAIHRLPGQLRGVFAGHALLHARIGQRLDEHVYVGRAAPRQPRDGVHVVLGHDHGVPHGLEDRPGLLQVGVGRVRAGRERRCAGVDEGRGVWHGADHRLVLPEPELEPLAGNAGQHANDEDIAVHVVADVGDDLGPALGLDGQQNDGGVLDGLYVVGRGAQARKLLGQRVEGRAGPAGRNHVLGLDQVAADHAADEGVADVAGADDCDRVV